MFCEEFRLAYRHTPRPSQKLKVSHGMPTRHLTDAQRQGFAHFDGEPSADQLARYFHLDQTDRDIIGTLRGDHNRLGFAVMLTSARFLGAFPVSPAEIPASVLAAVIEQLALEPATDVDRYFEGSRRIRHLALIRTHCGFTDFGDNAVARFRLTRWLYALCWSGDDRPGPLIDRATAWLIANNVYQVVLGSRTLGKGALHGGMPLYKYVFNRALTFFENVMLRQKLAEYHTGYRAFSREILQRIDYQINSEDFVFDNQMLSQIIYLGYEIAEITCPTRYFEEASSINFTRSMKYGRGVLRVSLTHRLHKWGLLKSKLYTPTPKGASSNSL